MNTIKKTGILLGILGLAAFMPSQVRYNDSKVIWHTITDVEPLLKESAKPVFIDFTAAWCGWCKVMDKKTFAKEEIASYINENYYAVKVDYDSEEPFTFKGKQFTGRTMALNYGVTGLPTIVFLSPDLSKSKSVIGYKTPKQFLGKLKKLKSL